MHKPTGAGLLNSLKGPPEGPQPRRVLRLVAYENCKNLRTSNSTQAQCTLPHGENTSLKEAYLVLWRHDYSAHAIRTGQRENSKQGAWGKPWLDWIAMRRRNGLEVLSYIQQGQSRSLTSLGRSGDDTMLMLMTFSVVRCLAKREKPDHAPRRRWSHSGLSRQCAFQQIWFLSVSHPPFPLFCMLWRTLSYNLTPDFA